jgi:hypothetical protein
VLNFENEEHKMKKIFNFKNTRKQAQIGRLANIFLRSLKKKKKKI